MVTMITAFKEFLEFLNKFIKDYDNIVQLPQLYSICRLEDQLDLCISLSNDIDSKMQPKRDHNEVLKTITWSWKWKDIKKALDVTEKQKTLMTLVMQDDMTRATLAIEQMIDDIQIRVKDQSHRDILK